MAAQVERMTANDYDEVLDFLNLVFSQAGRPHDFEKMLPKMCLADDEHMGKHLAIRDKGRIQALVGIYPLKTRINGRTLMFSTVGNVATHIKARGRGYMSQLMDEAMRELERIGADASRLEGLRQRYNRYGFEKAGTTCTYTLTARNVQACFGDLLSDDLRFVPIGPDDHSLLEQAWNLFYRRSIAVDRGDLSGFYRSLLAWEMQPWAAFDAEDQMIGYLTASANHMLLAEQVAGSQQSLVEMLCAWIMQQQLEQITFKLAPWEMAACQTFNRISENFSVSSASSFLVRNWQGLVDALLPLKASLSNLPEGQVVIQIEGCGSLALQVSEGKSSCNHTDARADIQVDRLTATRLLFGPFPPSAVCDLPVDKALLLHSWLPLPLSWIGQDRV